MLKKIATPLLVLLGVLVLVQTGFLVVTMTKINSLEDKVATATAPVQEEEEAIDEPGKEKSPVPVVYEGSPFRGAADAKVTIVEFTDFECPFCKQAQPTLDALVQKYEGKIKHVMRNYPISSSHAGAVNAAMGGLCAQDQKKFWEYHDLAFERANNGGSLTKEVLKTIAKDVGLDQAMFDSCFDSKKYISKVQKDFEDGNEYGVTGTPTFFINDRIVVGNLPIEEFERVIDEELQKN